MDVILFLAFAAIAVVCAVNLVVQTHPISSALSLIGVMGSLAVLYLLLGAEFIAMAQVIVYAGAIMVLFVFVIMLLNAGEESKKGRSLAVQLVGVPGFFRPSGVARVLHPAAFPACEDGSLWRLYRRDRQERRPGSIHALSIAVRGHLRADSDRHHRRDRACE